ncbi:hypothetical protein E1A91_A03G021000v1 [Gossypium mustelinum]|uniref:Uncharacterized protein n=1 Tax=Gossypium mustelinum TaxID=34275 RepID=A0A5D2ZU07_GOSMU|nr:hypothetical protein E1A91_A03G021000v1 [Gossypium mustelinum]
MNQRRPEWGIFFFILFLLLLQVKKECCRDCCFHVGWQHGKLIGHLNFLLRL